MRLLRSRLRTKRVAPSQRGACARGDDEQCAKQANLLYNTLGAKASQYVSLNTRTGVVSLQGISARAFGAEFGDFAHGLRVLIEDKSTFSLVTDSGGAAATGGGRFAPGLFGGGDILIETGMFPNQTGRVTQTRETALVHETGHALRQVFREHFDEVNERLAGSVGLVRRHEGLFINFEDRYHQMHGLGLRYTYSKNFSDVVVDLDVPLFPER